jgi:hypothetical protein
MKKIHHRVVVVESDIGSCGRMEKCATRFGAENRAEFLERLGYLARVESVDDQGALVPLPPSVEGRVMQNLYPEGR